MDVIFNSIIIGRYVPGESLVHQLDPRSKLVFVFFYVIVVFLANNELTYGLLGLYTALVFVLSRIPFRFIINGLKPILWVIIFTFILHLFFTKQGDILFTIGPVSIYEEALRQGVFISLRFLYLIVITTLLTLTTTPIEVTDGLENLLGPLKKYRFPAHELALMMSISLRFIPTLMQETEKIVKAQTARGANFTSGPISARIKAIIPLLIPLFIGAFKRAEELAVAMEARGYRGGEGRTKYRQLEWNKNDTMVVISLFIIAIALFLTRG